MLEFCHTFVVELRRELKPEATPGYNESVDKPDNTEKAAMKDRNVNPCDTPGEEDEIALFITYMNLDWKV
ncbi:Hypothetical predicted protein [Cloeon dipterum]|uniref:Uncharacterized protein n=1 Tax=Cloeon dipterum TaxID=197152 RepID=A0A8S1D9M3_9INSE|nr:Hypothetical predicted protein [Cloeon dipterum]